MAHRNYKVKFYFFPTTEIKSTKNKTKQKRKVLYQQFSKKTSSTPDAHPSPVCPTASANRFRGRGFQKHQEPRSGLCVWSVCVWGVGGWADTSWTER